jgi:hypothetical protein
MSTTTDPLAGFKSRLETALLATLREPFNEQAAERAARLAAPQWRGRRRVVIALAGLTALAIAAVALGPALLAPQRPGSTAFAIQPLAGGKLRVTLNGSLESPEARRELAQALDKYGLTVRFWLIPGPARLAGRVLSKDHTQPLGEFTYDTSHYKAGDHVTVHIGVGVTGHGPAVEVKP